MMRLKLREIRKQQGLSLSDIADFLGKTPATASRIERELFPLSVQDLSRLAAFLQVPIGDLIEQEPVTAKSNGGPSSE